MRTRVVFILGLMAAVVAAGIFGGTFVVGGSDSSCYVLQAERWAARNLQPPVALALEAPWPEASSTFAVSGHIASKTVPGAMVPVCASGLSIIMAAFMSFGGPQAVFLVVPFFGALLIGAVYTLGAHVAPRVGMAAAALTAASPVFLFQLVQPMSDVPAAALWCLATLLALSKKPLGLFVSGLLTSLAILVRPNLLPLGVVIGLTILFRRGLLMRERFVTAGAYAIGAAPGCVAVALIQQYFYGSPLSSGYGSAAALFALDYVGPNFRHYLTWLWETETPLCVLALAAPLIARQRLTVLCVALCLTNLACYLPYATFEEWWYVRFLLPTIPLIVILTVVTLDWALLRLVRVGMAVPTKRREGVFVGVGLAVVTVALMTVMIRTASDRNVFALPSLELRYARAGAFVEQRLPVNAAVLVSWESGSVTYYSRRPALVWDALDPAWLDQAIVFLRMRGLEPYLLVERWEEPIFRQRFAGAEAARLDWPPAAEIGGQVRIYRPEDRAKYFAGESVQTEYAR